MDIAFADLFAALGLALAIEGLLLVAAPRAVREGAVAILAMRAGWLRASGLAAAVAGMFLVWLARA